MANWGQPDFNDTVTLEEKSVLWMRIKGEDARRLVQWPHNDQVARGYPPDHVQKYCVNDAEWQKVRLSMKGKPTHEKLAILKAWWDKHMSSVGVKIVLYETEVQVGNYLGALRRGGQLDDLNAVRKYI